MGGAGHPWTMHFQGKQALLVFIVCLTGLVNSVDAVQTCSSDADCQFPGCNDISCSCSSSSSNCINGFWTGYSACKNGVWDATCYSGKCSWNGWNNDYGGYGSYWYCPDPSAC